MRLVADLWIPGVEFAWREKRKTRTARLPDPKGNRPKVIRIAGHYSVTASAKTAAAGKALALAIPDSPEPPLTGAVRLEVVYVFEPAASWPQWRRDAAQRGLVVCTGHQIGDLEQLTKLLCDGLEERGYVADDCQVTELDARKVYGEEQGYRVRVYDLGAGITTRAEALAAGGGA